MEYKVLVDYYKRLEGTTSKLKKADILTELFRKVPTKDLQEIVLLIQGIVYPKYEQMELGVATQLMIKAISKATGHSTSEIEKIFTKTGDLGLTVEECVKRKKQVALLKKKLTVDAVFNNIAKLALITGEKSQERKLSLIAELLVSAEPDEAKYIVRTILEELRVGAAEGIIRDAVAKAFLIAEESTKEEREEAIGAVEYAWNILSHFGEVAKIAKEEGIKGLRKVKPILGKPIQVMLGLAATSIEEVVEEFGKVAAEWKFDGMRIQLHKKGEKIWVFTRRLEDVTKQFPDIVKLAGKGLKVKECIVEGEALAIDQKTGRPLPFQILSQRIHRKYEIEKMAREIPIQVNLFDIVYLNGKILIRKPLKERWEILKKSVKPIPDKFQLAKHIVTDDIEKLREFYQEALNAGQEGIFLKVLNAPYTFGRHVGGWYKIKPVMETLDLVVVGAYWGEGARAKWLTSYLLACRDPDTGELLECGKMSTGLTEKEYQQMTKLLKPLVISSKGKFVKVKPKIVLEVAYQEIQKSPNYPSGFALRFPRFVRLRPEKSPEGADTLERVNKLFKAQRTRT